MKKRLYRQKITQKKERDIFGKKTIQKSNYTEKKERSTQR